MMKIEAINKLAEIMNRKDISRRESNRGNAMVLRKKEKECKKLQQELSRVSCIVVHYYHRVFLTIKCRRVCHSCLSVITT